MGKRAMILQTTDWQQPRNILSKKRVRISNSLMESRHIKMITQLPCTRISWMMTIWQVLRLKMIIAKKKTPSRGTDRIVMIKR